LLVIIMSWGRPGTETYPSFRFPALTCTRIAAGTRARGSYRHSASTCCALTMPTPRHKIAYPCTGCKPSSITGCAHVHTLNFPRKASPRLNMICSCSWGRYAL
jgi:hypothetical protein